MNSDNFERRVQRQPFREVPTEWRTQLLLNARKAAHYKPETSFWRKAWQGILNLNFKTSFLLWPSPRAWASLAVVWLLLLIVNLSTNDKASFASRGTSKPSPEKLMAWREQERLLTEMLGQQEIPLADRSKPSVPRPRSERQNEFRII